MTSAMPGAMLYQLSFEATQLGAGQFVGLVCSGEGLNEWNELFEKRVIDESLWSHQIGGISVYNRLFLKSVAHN